MPDEVFTWVDTDGTEHSLTSPPAIGVLEGRAGLFMPPIVSRYEPIVHESGARRRYVSHGVREVTLPLYWEAADYAALRTAIRDMLRWLDPVEGEGILRVQAPDGSERELPARYVGGLEGNESGELGGINWQEAAITFEAVDPYFRDRDYTTQGYSRGAGGAFFPFAFPFSLGASAIFTDVSIDNTGDVETWPLWTITGPGDGLVLENLTTDKSLSLTKTFAAGEVVYVDARPTKESDTGKTVRDTAGTNLFGTLSAASELWPLARGVNQIRVQFNNTTTQTLVQLQYKRRYLGM